MQVDVVGASQWVVSIARYPFGVVSLIDVFILSLTFQWLYLFRTLDLWRSLPLGAIQMF